MATWLIQKAPDVRRYWSRLADRETTWLEAFEQAELYTHRPGSCAACPQTVTERNLLRCLRP